MNEELTIEQEDELIRADMAALESGINDQEEETTENTEPVEEVESDESEAETTETADEVEKPKKKNNVAKILAEKNEYKRQAMEANKRLEELESSV